MREIEIKLKVDNLDELEKKLQGKGLTISKEISQHDVIYTNSNGDYEEMGGEGFIVVRIRREGDKNILTLKQQRSNEMDNLEYETIVGDFKTMDKILQLLGWKHIAEVKKTRKKGKLGEYEICLDSVDELGTYVELEKMTDDNADPEKVRDELFKALEPFGLTRGDEETKGYDTLIYLKNKK